MLMQKLQPQVKRQDDLKRRTLGCSGFLSLILFYFLMSCIMTNITDGTELNRGLYGFFLCGLSTENYCQVGPSEFQFQLGLVSEKKAHHGFSGALRLLGV